MRVGHSITIRPMKHGQKYPSKQDLRPNWLKIYLVVLGLIASGLGPRASAQYDPKAPEPITKPRGSFVIHGGGPVPTDVRREFVKLAGGNKARIVVVPTADASDPLNQRKIELWKEYQPAQVEFLHAESREQALLRSFAQPLQDATGVWFSGGQRTRLTDIYRGTPVADALKRVLNRGGAIGGSAGSAAAFAPVMLVGDQLQSGFDLLPGTIIDRRHQHRLRKALAAHPDQVGLGIDKRTTLVVRGRSLEVLGESEVLVCLTESADRPARTESLKVGQFADLIAFSRAAQARTQPTFPGRTLKPSQLDNGALIIAGGGGMPGGLLNRFITLAGGSNAHIVYIPCTENDVFSGEPLFVQSLRDMGAGTATVLHTKDRKKANDPEFLAPLAKATGIWFAGGRQWNLVDSYQHTLAHRLMHEVLSRGGVIAGSSAGASIQGEYMPRGDPLGNLVMMAEGYESGLGFLVGVAIDQHFTQRKRFDDMTSLMRAHPQLLGVGIDEGTALVVQKSSAEVVGLGQVAFFDYARPIIPDEPDYISVPAGKTFDLIRRAIVEDAPKGTDTSIP